MPKHPTVFETGLSPAQLTLLDLVPEEGLEPPNLAVPNFESGAYTIPPFGLKLPVMYDTGNHKNTGNHFYNTHYPPNDW